MSIDMTGITEGCTAMSSFKKEGNKENILPLAGKTIPHMRISGNISTLSPKGNFGPGSKAPEPLLVFLILFACDAYGCHRSGF